MINFSSGRRRMIMPKDYSLKKSKEEIGVIHPVIRSKRTGKIIAGNDRFKEDPTWSIEERDFKNRREEILFQIADNTRREISKEERKKEFQELYNIYKEDGIAEYNIAAKISEETGFNHRYVRRILKSEPQVHFSRLSKSKSKRFSEIRSRYQFLDEETILRGLKNPIVLCKAIEEHFSTVKKVAKLDFIELEKVKASLIKEIPNDPNLFHPLLEEWEKLHPYKKIVVRDKTFEELENDN